MANMAEVNIAFTNDEANGGPVAVLNVSDEKNYGSFKNERVERTDWRSVAVTWTIVVLLAVLGWCCLYLVVHGEVLPPGGLFQLLLLIIVAELVGIMVSWLRLPALLGMLLTGIAFRTSGFFHLSGVYPDLVVISRNLALSVILIKAGLGLDPDTLLKQKFTVLRLAALPCIFEACGAAVAAHLFFQVPWLWAFLTGFVLSPISPAVVVPTLLALKEKGYGEDKGISTLVIAASSIDDILSISVFGVLMTSIFTPGGDLTMSFLQGPLELVGGLLGGCVWGCICGFLALPQQGEWKLSALIGLGGFVAVVGSIEFEIPGAGPLATITSAFVANLIWTKRGIVTPGKNQVSERFSKVWSIAQPLLFGLIGAEVDLTQIEPSLLFKSITVLLSCLVVRLVACLVCLIGIGLNWREMVFVNLAWIPKATVQAALGPQPFDMLRDAAEDDPQLAYAKLLLTTAVLAIIITAPLGSIGISLTGPRFLNRAQIPSSSN